MAVFDEGKCWEKLDAMMSGFWEADRIENRLNPGFPDVFYSLRGRAGVIELKLLETRKAGRFAVSKFKPSQIRWHRRHSPRNHTVFVLAAYMKGRVMCGCLFKGSDVPDLVDGEFYMHQLRMTSLIDPEAAITGYLLSSALMRY